MQKTNKLHNNRRKRQFQNSCFKADALLFCAKDYTEIYE